MFISHTDNVSVVLETLHSDLPIFATMSHDFFDNYWMDDEERRKCVFAATNCVTQYCVQSRVARLFLKNGPTDRVAQSIKAHLRSKAPSSPKHQLVTAHIDKNYYFDLSIHIRTQSLRVEGADRKCRTEECMAKSIADTDKAFSDDNYWGCIDLLIRTKLAALLIERDYTRVTTEGWRIYLATDDVVLRPLFLNRLSHHGRVFYMAADISHFARGPTSGKDPMPTLADFFLIGRAHIMIEGREKLSSFAQFPALMTNASFATLSRRRGACKLCVKHEGFIVHSV